MLQTGWTLTSLGIEDEGFETTGVASQVGDFNGDGITDVIGRRNGQYQLASGPVDNYPAATAPQPHAPVTAGTRS